MSSVSTRTRGRKTLLWIVSSGVVVSVVFIVFVLPQLRRPVAPMDPLDELYQIAREYNLSGDDNLALVHINRAIEMWESKRDPDSAALAPYLELKSRVLQSLGHTCDALSLRVAACHIRLVDYYRTVKSKTATYADTASVLLRKYRDSLLSVYLHAPDDCRNIKDSVINFSLFVKGLASEHERRLWDLVRRKPSLQVNEIAAALSEKGTILAGISHTDNLIFGIGSERPWLDSILADYRKLQERLAEEAGRLIEYRRLEVGMLAKLLPKKSVFVDFAAVECSSLDCREEGSRYVAIVVDFSGQAEIVPLGQANVIDSLAIELQHHLRYVDSLPHWPSLHDVEVCRGILHRIYRHVIQPIEAYIANRDLLIVAPDAGLNLVPMDALVDNQGDYLIDSLPVHYVTSGREVIYEDIYRGSQPRRLVKDTFFVDESTTRAECLNRGPRSRYIYASVHGYTHPWLNDTMLAGPRLRPLNVAFDMDFLLTGAHLYDGLLKGMEASQLDMGYTEVVILTMCNSAFGNIRLGEGMRGSARGFRLAGARLVIGALWKIPKESSIAITSGLLTCSPETIPAKLRYAKLKKRQELRDDQNGKNDHPYYWAGLRSVGPWR